MLAKIRTLLTAPIIDGDAEGTRIAGVLNTLLLAIMALLVFTLLVLVPFVLVDKLYNAMFALSFLVILALDYWLIHRGRVQLASVVFVSTLWLVFTAFLPFAGGMTSIAVVFYIAGTVTAGLLLGTRVAFVYTLACALAGLVMALLESSQYALPRLFPIPPLIGWVDMILALLLTLTVVNLVVRSRNEAVASLRESEERYRQLFEAESDAILLIDDATGKILEANNAASTLYGYTREEFLTKINADLFDESEKQRVVPEPDIIVDQVINIPLRYHRKQDGTIFPVEITGRLFSREGRPVHIVAIRDITKRIQIEDELRQSEALYRQAIEVIGAVPYYQNYFPRTYTFMGEGIRQLTGFSSEEMTPKLWKSLIQDSVIFSEYAAPGQERTWTYAQDTPVGVWKSDELIETRDRQSRWIMDAAVELLDDQGTPYASLGLLQDVTERKNAEEALRESNRRLEATLAELRETQERMLHQERLAAVGQLAAGIAHDFNNILASIVLYTHMLLRSEEMSTQARGRLDVIVQQTNHAADLVQQILDFGRRSVLERQSLALDSFLKEVVRLLMRTLPENIHIGLDFAPGDYHIHADITRIQQVIVNLALNARDAMPNGGNLSLTLSRARGESIECVDCGPVVGGEWIQIAIADTGSGISPDVLPHIFEPFFTTRAPLGHGLGLAQVHGIVKQHDGHIGVETWVGEGTTFQLYWPAIPVTQSPDVDEVPPQAEQGHGETILIVEDDELIRTALIDVLDILDYHVVEAANGQEALSVCEQLAKEPVELGKRIDLVLSDWVMPVMGGLELVRELVARCQTVKVVLMTGYPLTEEVKDAVPQNVVGWILKPLRIEQLSEVISQALAKEL